MRTITPLRLDRVTRTVGHGDADERAARARLAALSAVEHPGVCVPLDVAREHDAVVACAPRVAGVTLAEAGRCASLGEWVWLVAGIADALAALHVRGLAHGDVAPGNVIVGARPVLVDLVGPALGRERGTPGFAAPERAGGGPPTPADDVHALGALALAAAAPAWRTEAEAWMLPLLDPDPDARPSAAAVAHGIARCAAPVRWRPEAPTDGAAPVSADARTETDPRAWAWRLRRRPGRLAAAVLAFGAAAAWLLWAPLPDAGREPVSAQAAPASASSLPDPADAARALTERRVDAVARGDGEALVAMTVPGSEAWVTASRQARQLAGGEALEDLAVEVTGASTRARDGTRATVEVTYRLSARVLVSPDGTRTEVAGESQRVVLDLAWSGEAWRVAGVSGAT
ncbi:hypothetical protein [Demequina soli]|uniref:hypothetical protein n=1 Tax=Demequina soli TaxID=1638987 RepID=UPI0007812DCE|nr:hypothetical protein [Demequina soli]